MSCGVALRPYTFDDFGGNPFCDAVSEVRTEQGFIFLCIQTRPSVFKKKIHSKREVYETRLFRLCIRQRFCGQALESVTDLVGPFRVHPCGSEECRRAS